MSYEVHALPVLVEPQGDECGLGFLLRSAHANGMDLTALLPLAGARSIWALTLRDIEVLASLVSISPTWLAERLLLKRRVEGHGQTDYMGWTWGSPQSLRFSSPQVCPECFAERPHCRAEWCVTGIFACPRHARLLIDHCRHCGKALTWTRPAAEVCRCGRYLTRGDGEDGGRVDGPELAWCVWLAARLPSIGHGQVGRPAELPDWLFQLSPDGAHRLLHALGSLRLANERLSSTQVTATPPPGQVQDFVRRGLVRAALLPAPGWPASIDQIGLVYEPGLQSLARSGATDGDQRAARYFLKFLARGPRRTGKRKGRPRHGQLELFGGEEH